jgi:hypothetical protein
MGYGVVSTVETVGSNSRRQLGRRAHRGNEDERIIPDAVALPSGLLWPNPIHVAADMWSEPPAFLIDPRDATFAVAPGVWLFSEAGAPDTVYELVSRSIENEPLTTTDRASQRGRYASARWSTRMTITRISSSWIS